MPKAFVVAAPRALRPAALGGVVRQGARVALGLAVAPARAVLLRRVWRHPDRALWHHSLRETLRERDASDARTLAAKRCCCWQRLNLALTKTDPLLKRINSAPVLKSMAIIGTVGVIFELFCPQYLYHRTVSS